MVACCEALLVTVGSVGNSAKLWRGWCLLGAHAPGSLGNGAWGRVCMGFRDHALEGVLSASWPCGSGPLGGPRVLLGMPASVNYHVPS